MTLQEKIEKLYGLPADGLNRDEVGEAFNELKNLLNHGRVRSAEPVDGGWKVNVWVKKGILLAFRIGALTEFSGDDLFKYFDKSTMHVRRFSLGDNVRIVPGGSAVRDGAFVSKGVVIMPPAYINIGAYVDEGTMIDSHALVGSCAQIGKRVHLSAAAQIGGVLEPIGAMPVVIEDDVMVGGNCGVYEGTIVKKGCVLASGVIITGSTPVYDIVNQTIYKKSSDRPFTIPENAVVVSGSRPLSNDWAKGQNISVYAPVIIKYRDAKTDAATTIEESLR
ncbi:MAG: 2,3,4,5-tetrahydropyridine-2,6-dicarboxylate N-succinyltransferase [Bacteroidetes bacterium]|nr:2,3,4,5-tetrahydropyridine-2,6-dicarboxylate N-succinyltransferase [Bacteroidota bacterium]MBU1421654.1 2,3,4,5-tetrahydropyridine-2,6-dicarboxylate N-succinyltransferase [Bacteroidota bacterium]MBU2472371.1 2,3,4,5-tetrahydropyridine-2,6-dicarboxylate N-succinyltransferase [Bacteroidota bacterium]MBU2635638.1 2,3,4,5-tetrahydropyridine-2,6-dicarboxylate N-succinyltransferase [Bacteroidota bacterium]